jgi:hypothetical protein
MSETAPGVFGTAPSHVSAAEWQSFEMRMRKRRAARLMVRAQAALEQGLVADAETALEEARQLDSSAPQLDTLLVRLTPAAAPVDVALTAQPAAPEPIESVPVRRFRGWIAVAASLLIVAALAMWDVERPEPQPAYATAIVPTSAAPSAEATPVPTDGHVDMTPATAATSLAARVPESSPLESAPSPPAAAAPATPAAAAPVTPVEPLRTEPVTELPAGDRMETRIPEPEPAPAPPIAAATSDVTVPPPVVSAPVAPPPPATDTARPDETPLVRRVLSQYEAAYSSLDVSAAKRVWPSLDTLGLARAFGGLQMQRISLGDCRVSFTAAGARADCRGSAQWTPKIGGGTRSGNRTWFFDLSKVDGQWRIVDATVR